jgi:hypothetical protein
MRVASLIELTALLAACALSPSALAAEPGKKVTLLFTGDNGGEVAPCG